MAAQLTYYEVLGLDEPPTDRKTVKRAYSKKLKVTRPEDDPEGFMRLRDAHDLALNIVARNAENAAWEAQQITVVTSENAAEESLPDEAPNTLDIIAPKNAPDTMPDTISDTAAAPQLTYADLLSENDPDAQSDTSYAIGATPNFDAPPQSYEPPVSEVPKLVETLDRLLSDVKNYNDREHWNQLFRKARKLDIDDYVDFEHILLEKILGFHGYFDNDVNYDAPEKMPKKLSPSIAASLFKTMNWDQVNTRGHFRGQQIEWLERRMTVRKRGTDPVPIPANTSGGNGKVWAYIFGAFILVKIIEALANI